MTERYAHLAPEVRSSFIDRISSAVEDETGSRGNGSGNLLVSRGHIGGNGGCPGTEKRRLAGARRRLRIGATGVEPWLGLRESHNDVRAVHP